MFNKISLFLLLFLSPFLGGNGTTDSILQSGPMVGHISYDHAFIWVQTQVSQKVTILYGKEANPTTGWQSSDPITTRQADAFTATLRLNNLTPATTYNYRILVDDKELPTTYRLHTPSLSNADRIQFSIALGSCVYLNDIGIPEKGGDWNIFQTIANKKPDMMFWLGDNIYLHEQDWHSLSGMHYRYSHLRQRPELVNLLANTANYAIWDDHDYGPNDSDRGFIGKDLALKAFQDFWANPGYGLPGTNGGITTSFSWGDCDFFLLDNRYFRSPQKRSTGDPTILGTAQREWLIDALCTSEAQFKFVVFGGLFLSSSFNVKNQNYVSNYGAERRYLLDQIEKNNLKNIIFLTGDKHFSEISTLTNRAGNHLWEITSSPLTAAANTRKDLNQFRVPGSLIQQRNFALLNLKGTQGNRMVTVDFFDAKGANLFSYEIEAQ